MHDNETSFVHSSLKKVPKKSQTVFSIPQHIEPPSLCLVGSMVLHFLSFLFRTLSFNDSEIDFLKKKKKKKPTETKKKHN